MRFNLVSVIKIKILPVPVNWSLQHQFGQSSHLLQQSQDYSCNLACWLLTMMYQHWMFKKSLLKLACKTKQVKMLHMPRKHMHFFNCNTNKKTIIILFHANASQNKRHKCELFNVSHHFIHKMWWLSGWPPKISVLLSWIISPQIGLGNL